MRGDLWSDPRREIEELPGIGRKLARKIIEDLGDGEPHPALALINRNPYALMDVDGIGFKRADTVAQKAYNVKAEDQRRHEAGNRSILQEKGVLNERDFTAERARLELRDPSFLTTGIEKEEGYYWHPDELAAEQGLDRWMRGLPLVGEEVALAELSEAQLAVLARLGADEHQTRAVRAILANPVLCFTGGAGVGKTFCVAAAAMCASLTGEQMRGMAFAGKAADRMREAFDKYGIMANASTIHKALAFKKRTFTLDWLAEKFIVVDESSMLPNSLMWAVVKRLPKGTHIVFVGDPQQLPPIGHGTPFSDLIAHGCARVHLTKNYRQADQQGILHMAEGVLHRRRPTAQELTGCVDLHFGIDPANFDPTFNDLIRKHGTKNYEAWQVITWKNEDVERLNLLAQQIINPDAFPLAKYACWKLGKDFRGRPLVEAHICEGDKVLVIKNSSTLDIFNGQTGRAVGTVQKRKLAQRRNPATGAWEEYEGDMMPHLRVEITGRSVDVPEDEIEKYLQLGYVITVHKAQGSDWPTVLLAQPGKVRDDTAKKFWYTSITRAKTRLVILSGLATVAWWTNAATDAPDEPSTLRRRLARPAPEPVVLDIHPEFVPAAEALLGRPVVAAPAPNPWDGPEDGVYWPEAAPAVAAQAQPTPGALDSRVAEIKTQFKALDLDGVA